MSDHLSSKTHAAELIAELREARRNPELRTYDLLQRAGDWIALRADRDAVPSVGRDGYLLSKVDRLLLIGSAEALKEEGFIYKAEMLLRIADLRAAVPPPAVQDCEHCGQLIEERDRYHDYADELAAYISQITGVEIGEHSNLNNPWEEAKEAAAAFIVRPAVTKSPHLADKDGPGEEDGPWAEGWAERSGQVCEDCPRAGYPTDKTRCAECPRRAHETSACKHIGGSWSIGNTRACNDCNMEI